MVHWNGRIHNVAILFFFFFLLMNHPSGFLVGIRWCLLNSKFKRIVCITFSWTDSGLCIYHLVEWSNLNLLLNSQWITIPTHSCLVKYFFCLSLHHSLITWWTVLSLSSNNQHFCCIPGVFSLICSYGIVCCFYSERFGFSRDFPFLAMSTSSRVQSRHLSLEISIHLFFPFPFSSFCCFSVWSYVANAAIDFCN